MLAIEDHRPGAYERRSVTRRHVHVGGEPNAVPHRNHDRFEHFDVVGPVDRGAVGQGLRARVPASGQRRTRGGDPEDASELSAGQSQGEPLEFEIPCFPG